MVHFFRLMLGLALVMFALAARAQTTVTLLTGWNLLGNGSTAKIDVAAPALFGDASRVTSVWKWLTASNRWAFYSPALDSAALSNFAAGKGYDVLSTVTGGEGFWVHASTPFSVQLPDTPPVLAATLFASLPAGWNLIATGETQVPADLDVTSLWAWDNWQSGWYFHSPRLNAGTELTTYIQHQGYLDFNAANKKLGPGEGFWIKKPEPWSLRPASEAGLTAYFQEAFGPASKSYLNTPWVGGVMTTVGTPSAVADTAAAVFSGTTLQEAGVDEADLIKSDGVHVFGLERTSTSGGTSNVLLRQQLNALAVDAALVPVDSLRLPFAGNVRSTGLYLDSTRQQLVAVGEAAMSWGIYDAWFAPQSWAQGATEVLLVDTSSTTQMKTRRTLHLSGQLIGSRRIGSTLYLVLRSYPTVVGLDTTWHTEKTASNQAVVSKLQAAQLLPTLSIDGGAAQPLVDAASCFTQEQNSFKSADVVTIVGIDLAAATHSHAARCFTGGTEAFYMSDRSLYLATTRNTYTYKGMYPVYAAQTSTDIHKFALSGVSIDYRGSGNVTGHLGFDQNRKSFRMGEYDGALRVITQTASTWGGWLAVPLAVSDPAGTVSATLVPPVVADSPGHLSILQESDGTLKRVGELPNAQRPAPLGKPGEQLYASRFIGARGYLVTYRLTDPLYVLDLSQPSDPKIAGELQVSGYSDYLFPLTENLLLGVGKEAISDGTSGDGRFAWYQGVKLSLIDVADPTHPREAARSLVGKRGTDATVLHDHHGIALQTLGGVVRVSLPVSLHDSPPYLATGAASDYFKFTRTELQKFEINLSGQSLVERPPLGSKLAGERSISSDRSLLWNNQVHYYQDGVWRSGVW